MGFGIGAVMLVIFHAWLLFVSCGIWNARAGQEDSWHYGHCIGTDEIRFPYTGVQEAGKELRVDYFQILNNCSFPSVNDTNTEEIDYSKAYTRYAADAPSAFRGNVHLYKESVGRIMRVRFRKEITYLRDMNNVQQFSPWVDIVKREQSSISSSFTVGLAGGLLSFVSIMIFFLFSVCKEEIVEKEKLD